jgi:8-oxo-dGTP pyrophosphatase MutT (NUDIX family)
MAARVRHAVRILLVDERERVLLFAAHDPARGGAPFWFPVGGEVEAGEDVQLAAAREIEEETGARGVALGPEVWHRRHAFTWRGVDYDQRERWFLARVGAFVPDGSGLTEIEQEELTPPRWWSLEELDATDDRLVPRDLATRLRALLAEGPPDAPIVVGV